MNWFKKKEEPTPVTTVTEPVVFNGDQERTFKDPQTGMFVYQRACTPEQRKIMAEWIGKNGQLANSIIMTTRQFLAIQNQLNEINKAITESEKEMTENRAKIRDEMKLDGRWEYNFSLGCMERRESPTA